MMEALAATGLGTTALALGCVIYLAYQLVGAMKQVGAVRDLADARQIQIEALTNENAGLSAQLTATKALLTTEQNLRASAESERNAAYQKARDHVVEQVKKSSPEVAAKLVLDLLGSPLGMPSLPAATASGGSPGGREVGPVWVAPVARRDPSGGGLP